MLINYQVPVLKKLLLFFLFAVNIFGLWPFKFIPSNRHIKYSCLKAFYSAFALCFGTSTYWIIGDYVFHIIRKNHFNTFTLKLVTSIHGYVILVIFLFVYIVPHIYCRKIEITFKKCKNIFDVMNTSFSHKRIGIWTYLLDIIVKTVIFDIVVALISLESFSRASNIMSTKIFFLLLLPPIAVRLHMNVFYGALRVFNIYFKKLNERLTEIVAEAKIVHSENHCQKYCDISDKIDEISIIHFRLTEATKSVNAIFSVTITLGHAFILIAVTIQSLLFFVGILEIMRKGTNFFILHNIFGCIFVALSFYDMCTTAYAAERLVREVCN